MTRIDTVLYTGKTHTTGGPSMALTFCRPG
jgi:hypothetical protein